MIGFHEAWPLVIYIQDSWDLLGRGVMCLICPSIHHIKSTLKLVFTPKSADTHDKIFSHFSGRVSIFSFSYNESVLQGHTQPLAILIYSVVQNYSSGL